MDSKEQVVLCPGWLKRLAGVGAQRGDGFLRKRSIVGLWEARLFVQNAEQALRRAEKEVERGRVVHKGDAGHVDAFAQVLFLFHDEDVAIEEILQLLVREVDTELLQAVVLQRLKPENVEQGKIGGRRPASERQQCERKLQVPGHGGTAARRFLTRC
jgi:hypothetical protein